MSIQERIRKLQEAMKGSSSSQGSNPPPQPQTAPPPAISKPIVPIVQPIVQPPQPIKKAQSSMSQPESRQPEAIVLSLAQRKKIFEEMAKKKADQVAKKEVMPLKQNNTIKTEEKQQVKDVQKQIGVDETQKREFQSKKSVPEPTMKKIQSSVSGVSDVPSDTQLPYQPNQLTKTMSHPAQNTLLPDTLKQDTKQIKPQLPHSKQKPAQNCQQKTSVQQMSKGMRMFMTAPPPRKPQQEIQAVLNQSLEYQKQAEQILNRGLNTKKNKKRQDRNFDDL